MATVKRVLERSQEARELANQGMFRRQIPDQLDTSKRQVQNYRKEWKVRSLGVRAALEDSASNLARAYMFLVLLCEACPANVPRFFSNHFILEIRVAVDWAVGSTQPASNSSIH